MDHFEKARQFFFEGLRLLEANDFQEAESRFGQSLELLPDRVSTLNNLSVVKMRLSKFAEAEELARKAVSLEETSSEAWSNLAMALTAMRCHEEALPACEKALQRDPSRSRTWLAKARVLLGLKRYEEALEACEQALKLDPSKYDISYTKSLILKELNRPEEAKKIYVSSLEMRVAESPVHCAERRATQNGDILIMSANPEIDDSLKSFEALHLGCNNFPGQLARLLLEDFHFTYVYAGDAARRAARPRVPQPDILINNNVNGEIIVSKGNLEALNALVDSFAVPVVNHPSKAIQTIRDISAKLLKDIPGIVVPKTVRFTSVGKKIEELVLEIEEQYEYPLITRTLTSQMGKGMTKVDNREALSAILTAGAEKHFFVTQFVDSRGKDPYYRKIRAAVVKGEIIFVRVDFDTSWNVHGRKSEQRMQFYLENSYLLDEENRICKDPAAALGQTVMQSLQTICDRVPLDAFGIDFDVNPAGQVVFYEANATMNLFSTARKEVPNPQEAEDRLKQSFVRYFNTLLTRR